MQWSGSLSLHRRLKMGARADVSKHAFTPQAVTPPCEALQSSQIFHSKLLPDPTYKYLPANVQSLRYISYNAHPSLKPTPQYHQPNTSAPLPTMTGDTSPAGKVSQPKGPANPQPGAATKQRKSRKSRKSRKVTVGDYSQGEDDFSDMDDDDYLSMGYHGIIMQVKELQEKRHKLQAEARKLEVGSDSQNGAPKANVKTSFEPGDGDDDDEDDDDGEDMLDSFDVEDLSFQETQGLIARLREDIKATEAKIKKLCPNKQKAASAVAGKASSKTSANPVEGEVSSSLGKKPKTKVTAAQAATPGASGHKVTKAKAKSSPRPPRKGIARPIKK